MKKARLVTAISMTVKRMARLVIGVIICASVLAEAWCMTPEERSSVTVQEDVEYGKAQGASLLLDVYSPKSQGCALPALILIHGGAFRTGDKKQGGYPELARRLALQGYVVFSVNYRLAPAHPYPAGLDDVQRAVRWIRSRAREYYVDPDRIGAVGHSAGAYYAAMLALRQTRANDDPELANYSSRVSCAVAYSGVFDLPSGIREVNQGRIPGIFDDFLGKSFQDAPEIWRDASPITYADRNASPMCLFHGTGDSLVSVEQSRRFYNALRKAGADIVYFELDGAGHGWSTSSPFGCVSEPECERFLARHL